MKLVKVPFSGGSLGKNLGCELAPDEISKNINSLNVKNKNIEEAGAMIYNFVKNSDDKLFLLGGDHSITYYSFSGFAEKNAGCGLVVFDAHPDMQSSDFVTHEDYLRVLIDKKILRSSSVVLVGVRSISREELEYLRENKIIYFDMNKIYDLGIKEVCDLIMEKMGGFSKFYLSIDIDVLDPAFAPGTGYLEPGGISSSDLFYFLNRIKNMKNLSVVDLVEVNPKKDINNTTTLLGSKIVGVFL